MDLDLPYFRKGAGGTVRTGSSVHSGPSGPDRCLHLKVAEGQGGFLHIHLPFDIRSHRRQKDISHPFILMVIKVWRS